jgi:hypothetical protein
VIMAYSDVGMLLALRRATIPSVVHMRKVAELPPEDHIALLVAILPTITEDLELGAIGSMSPSGWTSGISRTTGGWHSAWHSATRQGPGFGSTRRTALPT